MNVKYRGPDLDAYTQLESRKCSKWLGNTSGTQFYKRYGTDILHPAGLTPAELGRHARFLTCLAEQLWMETRIAHIVALLMSHLELEVANWWWINLKYPEVTMCLPNGKKLKIKIPEAVFSDPTADLEYCTYMRHVVEVQKARAVLEEAEATVQSDTASKATYSAAWEEVLEKNLHILPAAARQRTQ